MEHKFTKGPWKATGISMSGKNAFKVVGTALGGKFKIAHCFFHHDDTFSDEVNMKEREEAEANAKAIAGLPELIESLKDGVQLIEYLINALPTGEVRNAATDWNIIARTALNKALD